MAYNVTDLVTQVQSRVRDSSFDVSEIIRYLDVTQRSILNRFQLPFMEKVFEGTLTVGVHTYELQDDTHSMINLVIIDPDDDTNANDISEHYIPFRQFDNTWPNPGVNTNTRPFYWTIGPGGTNTFRKQLYFTAPSDKTYTMRAKYLKSPTLLTQGDDIPEIPEEFQEVLVLGAVAMVHEFKDKYDLAQLITNRQEDLLSDMTDRLNTRQRAVSARTIGPRRRVNWR